MEHAATANGDHRSQVLVTVDSANLTRTLITATSTTPSLLTRPGSPAIAIPLEDAEIDALLVSALHLPPFTARSIPTQQWYSAMTNEQQTIIEQGLEAIIYHGCHLAAKRSYETILMQKRANNEANDKHKHVMTTIPAKSISKSIDSSSKGSMTGREREEQYYGRDVDSYSASVNSGSRQTVTSYAAEYYYGGRRGPPTAATTTATVAAPTAVGGVGVPYYDDFDHSHHQRHSRDRDYYDDRFRQSSRSREQRQERYNGNDYDYNRRRSRSNSRTRRDRQRQRSRSPTQDGSQRPNHPRSRSRSPARRNDRDYDRDTLSASFRSRSLDSFPPKVSRIVDDLKHKERQRRNVTEETASHAVASVRQKGLDDASTSQRHRRLRSEKDRDHNERTRRSDRNRSPSTDSRSSWSSSRSPSRDHRGPRASDHFRRDKGSRRRSSSSHSDSSNLPRTKMSKEEAKIKRRDRYHNSSHRNRVKKRHGSSNSPGDSRAGPQSDKQSSRRSSRKRRRNVIRNGTDGEGNLK